MSGSSRIEQFYAGQTVFLTGATGFVGKLILEKLLRVCYGVEKVYVLIRPKKQKTLEERLAALVEHDCFSVVKSVHPDFKHKIRVISGDCGLPSLGISDSDRNLLEKEVTCIIHAAANVKFDMDLKTALYTNVRSVRDILTLAEETVNLKALVYVSTAFSHCHRSDIEEKFYDVSHTDPEKLLAVIENLDERTLKIIAPHVLGKWPNTYVLSKALAEDLVRRKEGRLPIAIVRPAIVISTAEEPMAGWIDNFSGIVGLITGISLGVIRSVRVDKEVRANLVPADFVVNNILAAAWNVDKEQKWSQHQQKSLAVPIYNCTPVKNNSVTWGGFLETMMSFAHKYPLSSMIWYYCLYTTKFNFVHKFTVFFLHTLYAHFVDIVAQVAGKKAFAVGKYKKINKLLDCLTYFSTRSFNFSNDNFENLYASLNETDKRIFNFDMKKFDWTVYFESLAIGGRIYLVKDPLSTIPQAKKKVMMLGVAHYTFILFLIWLTFSFFKYTLLF